MLSEVFIRKAAIEAMTKYAAEHDGKNGVAKADVIQIVMEYGGDMEDIHDVMEICVLKIAPELVTCKFA